MKDYHINIFYSDRDRAYVAGIPDFHYCTAFGDTPAKALREVEKAKRAWIETAKETGRKVPKPKYRPAIYQPR